MKIITQEKYQVTLTRKEDTKFTPDHESPNEQTDGQTSPSL